MSDVFESVWNVRKKLPEIDCIESWLHRIAHNKSISFLRKESKWRFLAEGIPEDFELRISLEDDSSGQYGRETVERLNKAIAALPPKCRNVVYLAKIEKFSYRKVAAILGISAKTVGNHLSYAMKKLSEALSGGDSETDG